MFCTLKHLKLGGASCLVSTGSGCKICLELWSHLCAMFALWKGYSGYLRVLHWPLGAWEFSCMGRSVQQKEQASARRPLSNLRLKHPQDLKYRKSPVEWVPRTACKPIGKRATGVWTKETVVFQRLHWALKEALGEKWKLAGWSATSSVRLQEKLVLMTFCECLCVRCRDNLTQSPQPSVRNNFYLQLWVGFELVC